MQMAMGRALVGSRPRGCSCSAFPGIRKTPYGTRLRWPSSQFQQCSRGADKKMLHEEVLPVILSPYEGQYSYQYCSCSFYNKRSFFKLHRNIDLHLLTFSVDVSNCHTVRPSPTTSKHTHSGAEVSKCLHKGKS